MAGLLAIEQLSIGAGSVELLRGLDVSLEPGEQLAVTGPSGLGKTTLLRTIAGLTDPLSGRILLRGRSGDEIGWPTFRRQVVLMQQKPTLTGGTVRENLQRPFAYRCANGCGYDGAKAAKWLDSIGIEPTRLDQPASELSVGQQQRVCLVRSLLVEPLVLLLDEPTSALDTDAAEATQRLVDGECRNRGLAVMIVTHHANHTPKRLDLNSYKP
ncbi:MAG: ATP-binding cassette domain-containing protein [Phycisphaeraceae bacterium]|nr:ATP-binding cassette domain-containing protein [Phycisphaeraceae bacterium]